MSKFADILRRAGHNEPAPLGFASVARKTAPGMMLVGVVKDRWRQSVSEAVDAGADAILLTGRVADKDLAEAIEAAGGRPSGVLAPEADGATPERLHRAGVDFAVVELQASAGVLLDEQLGFLLRLPDDLTDVQLRALDSLSLDAFYLERPLEPLTIARQLELQRVSGLTRKRLLVRVAADLENADLMCLRESGVGALAIDMHERHATDLLRSLRQKVDALPATPRSRRREERPEPLLPRAAVASEHVHEDEDDDYDE